MINENAISNILVDVDFLDEQFRGIGRGHLSAVFTELRLVSECLVRFCQLKTNVMNQTTSIPLSDAVQDYLVPATRQVSYSAVKSRRLQALLEKLAKYGAQCKDNQSREKGERRRKEAEAVGRLYPGENR